MRLFVGNLPFDVNEQEVREFFATVGTLTFLHLPMDRATGKPRGFAFVEFADPRQAREAIERFNRALFRGRPLAINEARAPGSPPPPREDSRPPMPEGNGGWAPASDEYGVKPSRATPPRHFGGEKVTRKKKQREKTERSPRRAAHTRTSRILDDYDFGESGEAVSIDDVARRLPEDEE